MTRALCETFPMTHRRCLEDIPASAAKLLNAPQPSMRAFLQAKRLPHTAVEQTGITAAFPVMSTKHGAWETVTAIDRIQPSIRPTSAAKIKESKVGLYSLSV